MTLIRSGDFVVAQLFEPLTKLRDLFTFRGDFLIEVLSQPRKYCAR